MGQLSVIEHALCPLDSSRRLQEPLTYRTGYYYTDPAGRRQFARVTIRAPAGLSAYDEYYLWGLLALTFAQREPGPELWATPHYCLRQLGEIRQRSDKAAWRYRAFREAVDRLAEVSYHSDAFYNPVRGEYLERKMGFLKYELPQDPDSSRAWRIVWDPLFFEFCQATGGRLFFDLALYRRLDPACRRLFLLLHKIFAAGRRCPAFDVGHLAVHVLGFSPAVRMCDLKVKLARLMERLAAQEVLALPAGRKPADWFTKQAKGRYTVRFQPGRYFTEQRYRRQAASGRKLADDPLYDPLKAIGLAEATISHVLATYTRSQIQVWSDVTLMALEKQPPGFPGFKQSPQAFFMHHIQKAASERRSPPDWWHEAKKAEQQRQSEQDRRQRQATTDEIQTAYRQAREKAFRKFLHEHVDQQAYDQALAMFRQLHEARLPAGEAEQAARRDTDRHFAARFQFPSPMQWFARGENQPAGSAE